MKESLPKIDSSCNDTFRRISKVPTMPVLSRFTYTAYVLADSLFFSSTPGASSSRGRLQVGGVCKSGASASRERLQERLHAGSAFKSGTPSSRERLYVGMNNSTPHVFKRPVSCLAPNAACFFKRQKYFPGLGIQTYSKARTGISHPYRGQLL